jgi:hypothetical protein
VMPLTKEELERMEELRQKRDEARDARTAFLSRHRTASILETPHDEDRATYNAAMVAEMALDNAVENALPSLLASARKTAQEGWQPIETAPRDGTWVLFFGVYAYGRETFQAIGRWMQDGRCPWSSDHSGGIESFAIVNPIAWMPLPTPPSFDQESGGTVREKTPQ